MNLVNDLDENQSVAVQKDYACPNCQRVNDREQKPMVLSEFNKLAIEDPEAAWKEDVDGKIVYRVYVESNKYRCRGGC